MGFLDPWRQQGQRCTPPPHRMPVWREDGRPYTLCAGCMALLFARDAPYCAGCRAKVEQARRHRRAKRKRAAVRTRLWGAA